MSSNSSSLAKYSQITNAADGASVAASAAEDHANGEEERTDKDREEEPVKVNNKWLCLYFNIPSTASLNTTAVSILAVTLIVDAIANVFVYCATRHWWFLGPHRHPFSYVTWDDFKADLTDFHHQTSDTIVLYLVRVLSIFVVTFLSIYKGVPKELWNTHIHQTSLPSSSSSSSKKSTANKDGHTQSKYSHLWCCCSIGHLCFAKRKHERKAHKRIKSEPMNNHRGNIQQQQQNFDRNNNAVLVSTLAYSHHTTEQQQRTKHKMSTDSSIQRLLLDENDTGSAPVRLLSNVGQPPQPPQSTDAQNQNDSVSIVIHHPKKGGKHEDTEEDKTDKTDKTDNTDNKDNTGDKHKPGGGGVGGHKDGEKDGEKDEFYTDIEGIVDNRHLQPQFEDANQEKDYQSRKQMASVVKYALLLLLFLLFTFYQGWIGVKSVTFEFDAAMAYQRQQAFCFGLIILCINIEIFVVKSIVEQATDYGEGIIVKSLHPHPMYKKSKVKYWCNLCRHRATFFTYRCQSCSFDVCSVCFKKQKKKLMAEAEAKRQLLRKQARQQQHQSQTQSVNGVKDGGTINLAAAMIAESDNEVNVSSHYSSFGKPENDPTLQAQKEMTSTQYILKAMKLCAPHWRVTSIALFCLLITASANLFLPLSQGRILDRIISFNKQGFYAQIEIYIALSVVVGFFGAIRSLCFRFTERRLNASVRSLMFRNIVVQDIAFFDDMSTGEIISRLTSDVWGMLSPLQNMLQGTLSNIIALIGGLIMCFFTSWRLSMLAFTTVAPVIFLTGQYAKWSRSISRSIWAAFGSSTSIATQAFSNIRTVRAFGAEKKEIGHYDEALREILERGIMDAIASTATFTLTNYLDLGASVLILYFGGLTIFDVHNGTLQNANDLTVGKLITFQLYWNMINTAYKGLTNVLTSFTRAAGAAQRVLTLLDSLAEIDLDDGIRLVDDHGSKGLDGYLFIEGVHFTYKSRPEASVLNGIDLEIHPGEVVALVGRSGGGKSTLIHLLMRFYDVTQGAIYYNKERIPLKSVNLSDLRHAIGLVAQDTQLFDCSLKENIIYGIEREYTMDELVYVCKLANAHEFIDKFEDKYETRVGERGVRLSGGQKQRIAIARMLMKRPSILFLDEATSNLDTESEALVQAAIDKSIWKEHTSTMEEKTDDLQYEYKQAHDSAEELDISLVGIDAETHQKYRHRANSVILVAHRLSTVINADKIAVIDKGRIVELGSHSELLELENGVYRKLVQRQIQREENQLNQEKESGDAVQEKVIESNIQKANKAADGKKKPKGGKKDGKKKSSAIDDIDSLFDDA